MIELIIDSLPRMISGTLMTIELTILSVLLGLSLAIPLAMLYLAKNPLLSMPVRTYVFYFRGTPLLVQIFLIYYGSGQFVDELKAVGLWTFFREPYFCAVLSLTLNTAAYTAYILRGAILNVPFGEIEAARASGMSRSLLYRRIVLPLAFRIGLPAYTNEVVFLFQATSLVSIISLLDLTGIARIIVARSFAVYEIYLTAAVMYLIITYAMLWGFRRLEHWWSGHLRDRVDMGESFTAR